MRKAAIHPEPIEQVKASEQTRVSEAPRVPTTFTIAFATSKEESKTKTELNNIRGDDALATSAVAATSKAPTEPKPTVLFKYANGGQKWKHKEIEELHLREENFLGADTNLKKTEEYETIKFLLEDIHQQEKKDGILLQTFLNDFSKEDFEMLMIEKFHPNMVLEFLVDRKSLHQLYLTEIKFNNHMSAATLLNIPNLTPVDAKRIYDAHKKAILLGIKKLRTYIGLNIIKHNKDKDYSQLQMANSQDDQGFDEEIAKITEKYRGDTTDANLFLDDQRSVMDIWNEAVEDVRSDYKQPCCNIL